MISSITSALSCVIILINVLVLCTSELPQPPSLTLYSPGEVEYTDVIVKRVEDNLTLVCELKGDTPKVIVWNYVAVNESGENRPFTTEPIGPSTQVSTLTKTNLQLSDSGHYMCSSPPFSQKKYILVQNRGPHQCARGAFWCGARCVLASYVCDGREDCRQGEDEAPALCGQRPCLRADKLNCSTGRCVPSAACCRSASLCRQPACCDEHPRYSRREDFNVEFPPLFEDRHAPDDYGFIQSTIYTVTACALIFMIAVVLLVSAICKMHMKRRSYGAADRVARQHYNMHYAQTHRFPPCYEESRLLSELPRVTPTVSAHNSPIRVPSECATDNQASTADDQNNGFGLARLSAIFNSRYRQVPTQCCDVEMSDVRTTSLQNSPTRNRTLDPYRSPTYCDMNPDLFFSNPDTSNCGRDLNYMATPIEVYRRRTLRNHLDRVIDNIERQRPLTLQLGRFQLSIPRFSRRSSNDRRPDTPNVAEINIDDLDFVRLNGNDTYTLNGRTIRLLGASFENYPGINLNEGGRPPPYNEAMRYKLYGPPPEYLSRDGLNDDNNVVTVNVDDIARNVELPPNYDELNDETVNNNGDEAAGGDLNANNVINIDVAAANNDDDTVNREAATTNNSLNNEIASADNNLNADIATANNSLNNDVATINNTLNNDVATANSTVDSSENNAALFTSVLNDVTSNVIHSTNNNIESNNGNSDVAETISSVIDNLPAIDSDVNAN